MYGSRVFVRIPEERRKSKWDKKAETGILLGYTDTGYRVLINNRVIVVRHCDIVEEDVTMCGFQDERDDNLEEEKINKNISESVGRNDTDKLNSNNDIEIDEDMDKKNQKTS
ncbi:hypothetical protein EVAR_13748_1 [Eumeta japonica]|uniref:Retroviral polymerase SH3-like domain-containing protein n=1 Tax=Eumeta variegata TaxID=151549 RepID=A0A4C1UCE0_EUMVA|nr:hypothetical protein EVAR_13748_1 [Eumeta japonica]